MDEDLPSRDKVSSGKTVQPYETGEDRENTRLLHRRSPFLQPY